MTVLVTGAAGFIGSNLGKRLLQNNRNVRVVGIARWYKEFYK